MEINQIVFDYSKGKKFPVKVKLFLDISLSNGRITRRMEAV